MVQKDDSLNKRAAEILLDRLIEAVAELQDKIDDLEQRADRKDSELHSEIEMLRRIAEDMKMILDYKETVIALGKNASSQGVVNLIRDVDDLKIFMSKQKERQDMIKTITLSLLVPLGIFALGMIWWLFQHYLLK